MSDKLTEPQADILKFIVQFIRKHRMSPTVRDVQEAFGFASPNAAFGHLERMAKKGVIDKAEGFSRGIRLVGPTCECCNGLGVRIDK